MHVISICDKVISENLFEAEQVTPPIESTITPLLVAIYQEM